MKIAPIDIAHKTFSRKVMGYDQEEVNQFLRDLADQLEEVFRERNSLKDSARQKDMQMLEYRERDDVLKATLATATKMAEQMRVDAEREGKLILQDAHQKADLIIKDGRDQLKRVYQDIADLKRLRMQFEVNMRSLIQAHVSMLDQSHITAPDPNINLSAAMHNTSMQGQQQAHGHQGMHPSQMHPGASAPLRNAQPQAAPTQPVHRPAGSQTQR